MSFRIYCDNKGCFKDNEALYDVASNEVHCAECGKKITNITSFAVNQMKSMGQIKRDDKKAQAFSMKCLSCKRMTTPKIKKDKALCALCGESLDVSPIYMRAIQAASKNL